MTSAGWPRTATASWPSGRNATRASRRRRIDGACPARGAAPYRCTADAGPLLLLFRKTGVPGPQGITAWCIALGAHARIGQGSMSSAASFLRIRDLEKRFGAFTALKDIDLDVAKSEFVCFLGPSGCGKTTLLRAIAGLDPQSSGTIEIGGYDVSNLPPAARDFGIVFQSYALFPNLTVAANVGYGLLNRRSRGADIDRRVAELLALVGLPEQGAKYPAQLSGGQQQRVAL